VLVEVHRGEGSQDRAEPEGEDGPVCVDCSLDIYQFDRNGAAVGAERRVVEGPPCADVVGLDSTGLGAAIGVGEVAVVASLSYNSAVSADECAGTSLLSIAEDAPAVCPVEHVVPSIIAFQTDSGATEAVGTRTAHRGAQIRQLHQRAVADALSAVSPQQGVRKTQ
jgi:hypothetical protein